jgi:signal transduction histidine kinase
MDAFMQHSQLLHLERHERIAKLIQRDVGVLVERWARRAVSEQPHAKRSHHEILLDELAAFLLALAQSLDESSPDKTERHRSPAARHGEQRWQNGWSLPEVIRDYQLLRTVLMEYLDEFLDSPLGLREILAINLIFDEAIAASVGSYVAGREETIVQVERERAGRDRLAEAQSLRQLTEALREADRHKDEFLAILGHELRNPLAPIRNVLQLLKLKPSDPTTLLWAREVVERQVTLLTRLVDDLLDITRISRGMIQLRLQPLDLARLLSDTAEDHRATLEANGVAFQLELPAVPVVVSGDTVRLAQVVGNLLHNATKFTSQGGRVEVQLQPAEAERRAVVRVRDSGEGIAPNELPLIFDTFRQAERSRHDSRGGLGLGLALVKGLVELHGGEVRAASAGVGQGAEFTFWLPLDGTAAESS